jgi:hypothetical protein
MIKKEKDARNKQILWIIIRMFYNDHNPPHFHIIYQEDEALML